MPGVVNSSRRTIELMATEDAQAKRLRFYGLADYGTFWQVERAVEVLEQYDSSVEVRTTSDVIELYNAQQFAENALFPASLDVSRREACQALIPQLQKTIAKHFNGIDTVNQSTRIADVDHEYHADLLQLLGKFGVYERVPATALLPVLESTDVSLSGMLACQKLVRAYDQEVRALLTSSPSNAEHLIRKHLQDASQSSIYLPASLTLDDSRALVDVYLESDKANLNFVELVSLAAVTKGGLVSAKLKLKAQRKHEAWTKQFFESNPGITTGCEVSVSDEQVEEVVASRQGLEVKYSYSRRWLEDNLDRPTILNNFIYLFGFADLHTVLTSPSYYAQLGIVDRYMRTLGKNFYREGATFRMKDHASFLQTMMYDHFLRSKGVELESVISWFFADYLKNEFGAENFRYPPSTASTYLEKCRHVFIEMESVVKQFSLYVEDGLLDPGLLAVTSDQVRYKDIPSLMHGKYVYAGSGPDVHNILRLLFSDQSGLAYISETLRAENAASLLTDNEVAYGDFHEYQHAQVDYLIQQGVLEDTGQRVQFVSRRQLGVLRNLFESEAVSYYHYSTPGRESVDGMVARGWLERRESLLTDSEAQYFNYLLNQVDFSNGPDLRNKYLHGTQADAAEEDEHFKTYITALKLLIALVIKMNDDFCLRDDEASTQASGGEGQ